MNSDNKANNIDSDSKTPIKLVEDFQVNPFKDYQNDEEFNEENEKIMSSSKFLSKKERKVPLLFQTKPLKEVMEQVKKMNDYQSEAKARLHEKQWESISEEIKSLRFKPEISKTSKRIMQQKEYIPLYKRTAEILNKKEAKLTEERKRLEEQKDALEKGLTFKPELCKNQETYKSFGEFEESMKHWTRIKKENIAKKQFMNLEKEVQNHPFKPEINEKSKKILQRKGNSQEKKVETRLLESFEKEKFRKIQEIERNKPEFQPSLTSRTHKLVKQRRNKTNYLVEFLQSPEKIDKISIEITSQGVEVSIKDDLKGSQGLLM